MIQLLQNYILEVSVRIKALQLRAQSGQGALEYIAIVVGLVLLIAAGFTIAGGNIGDEAGKFVKKVLNATK
jgi:hypothetical protein